MDETPLKNRDSNLYKPLIIFFHLKLLIANTIVKVNVVRSVQLLGYELGSIHK
jgi:hypothetical protein